MIFSDPKYNKDREALADYQKAFALAPQNKNIAYWSQLSEYRLISNQK
jgi:hypothetical protein